VGEVVGSGGSAEQAPAADDAPAKDDLLILRDQWAAYVASFSTWTAFYTLTFSDQDRTHDVTLTECNFLWRRLVQLMNRNLYGNNYTRIVGHCYFDYALAFEYQKRGALHMHALVSGRTHWEFVNRVWRHMAGIVKIVPVDDSYKTAKYLCKYITKGGDVILHRAKRPIKEPSFKPLWYIG